MKAKEMRQKSTKELQKELADTRGKLLTAQIDYRTKEIKNVREIRALRRDIARLLTVTHEQELTAKGDKS